MSHLFKNQKLTAWADPLLYQKASATYTAPSGFADQPVNGLLNGRPFVNTFQIRYIVSYLLQKIITSHPAQDLPTFKTLLVKVVGPPPLNGSQRQQQQPSSTDMGLALCL